MNMDDNFMAADGARCIQSRIRDRLRHAPTLTRVLQAARAVLHFGPWRHAARAIIRRNRPPQYGIGLATLDRLDLNKSQLVQTLRVDGMAVAGQLPPDVLSGVRAIADELPPGVYGDIHEHPEIRILARSARVLDVVRGYLRAEPELLECTLTVHAAENPASRKIHGQRHFHFDYAGWHSLVLFIYLTDVREDSGAHEVVVGTHGSRSLWDAIRISIPDEEVAARYAGRIRTITGAAGTMFFENTDAFHRRLIMRRRRVMLSFLYASHRSWLSKGRLVPKHADYLRSHEASDLAR